MKVMITKQLNMEEWNYCSAYT